MEVARRARPGRVGLGHERDPPAVEVGDLLRAVLEDHAPVGRLEDVVVADVDLVLAGRRLALAELDRDPGRGHLVAQQAVERLGLGGLEEVVVLVVVAEALGDRPAPPVRLLPRLLEHVVLELRAGLHGESERGRPGHLALEDRPRGDGDLVAGLLVGRVAQDHRRLLEPRQDPQRVPDRPGDPVAVAGLPVHQGEPVGRVHLHVGAQQVRAEVRAVVDHPGEERLGLDALAHQPALHVGDRHDQRVDPPVADHRLELEEPGMLGVAVVFLAHAVLLRLLGWLLGGHPAVGDDHGAGHERRLVRGQEQGDVGDLARLARAGRSAGTSRSWHRPRRARRASRRERS